MKYYELVLRLAIIDTLTYNYNRVLIINLRSTRNWDPPTGTTEAREHVVRLCRSVQPSRGYIVFTLMRIVDDEMKRTKRNKFPASGCLPPLRSARNALNRDERVERTRSPSILFFFPYSPPFSHAGGALKRKFRIETLKRETHACFPPAIRPTKLVFMYVTSGVISRCSPAIPGGGPVYRSLATRLRLRGERVDGQWFIGRSLAPDDVLILSRIMHRAPPCATQMHRPHRDAWWLHDELDSKMKSCRGCVPLALVPLCWTGPINVI